MEQTRDFAFRGMLTCGRCGCVLSPERKKGKYTYYHCTQSKGPCDEPWVREEVVGDAFGDVLEMLNIEERIADIIVSALKASHENETQFHDDALIALRAQYDVLQKRISRAYTLMLDGKIDEDIWGNDNAKWRLEQSRIEKDMASHKTADRSYIDTGARILELARKARKLHVSADLSEKKKLLAFVLQNSVWLNGKLIPNFRQPFDILAKTNIEERVFGMGKAAEIAVLTKWRGVVNSLRTPELMVDPVVLAGFGGREAGHLVPSTRVLNAGVGSV